MNFVVIALYLITTIFFSLNLKVLYKKYKAGNSKITLSSLMATVSLIVAFLSLSIYFYLFEIKILIASQIYLLLTMFIIMLRNNRQKK